MKINLRIFIGIALSLLYLIIHLLIINDYGISWDFHYHHFAGLYHLGQKVPKIDEPYPIPFTAPDPRLTTEDPFGPFTQILPSASYLLFYEKLHLLPFDSAYNLPAIMFGSLGVFVLFLFLYEAINFPVALFSAVFLALLPTHFGYLHNNMKDVPNAFAFTLAIYLFWRLVKYQRIRDLLLAIAAFAFSFNVKINSILIPVINLFWFVGIISLTKFRQSGILSELRRNRLVVFYFFIAPFAALLVWWPFWKDPMAKLLEIPYFYSHNTLNMPVLFAGTIYRSGVNIPWIYPWVYIFITTPLGILFSFLIGIFVVISKLFKKNDIYALLLIWFLIPLLRYFSPKVSAIDGMRHFMEVIYPLSALAGIGFFVIYRYLKKLSPLGCNRFTPQGCIGLMVFGILIITLVYNLVKFHPYQTSFYNVLTGGVKGAEGRFDIDFWGAPQKDAMMWLNKNAKVDSFIHVVMAQSSAAMYVRRDLQDKINRKSWQESDYTVILNKQSFFEIYPVADYLRKSLKENKLVYQKTLEGVPLFWIINN